MSTVYILQNQHGYYLKKPSSQKEIEWLDGQEPAGLFRTPHKDEALNMMVETNSRNVELRLSILEYPTNPKKHPIIPADDLPPPIPKQKEEDLLDQASGDDGNIDITAASTDNTTQTTIPEPIDDATNKEVVDAEESTHSIANL